MMHRIIPVGRIGLAIIFFIGLAACETVEDRRDMLDTQSQLKEMIKDDIGVDSLVGFNLDQGVLIDVSFAFDSDSVADRTVSELRRAVRSAVRQSFETAPRAIYIQIATTAK